MKYHARVVVIGGGIVGCSALYHLGRLGWTDSLLVERDELTSGSTWHSVGNVPTFSTSWAILRFQRYGNALYNTLGAEVDYPINYHVTGSIRLAHTPDRMDEFRHVVGMARAQGLEYEMLTPPEARERYPFLELHDIRGALWDPYDGDIDPAQVTQAFARGARDLGAEIVRFNPVHAIEQAPNGEWRIHTKNGTVTAEIVINAAGFRAAEVGAMVGLRLPVVSMQHQYLVTEPVAALKSCARKLPLLRDPDVSWYLRQERDGLLLGPYEWDATPVWLDGIPPDFGMELLPNDLERLERYIEDAMQRVPPLRDAGIQRVVNGAIPYTPDGNPLIGPAYPLRNHWLCCAFSFGICQGGGAGKVIAEMIVHGESEWDMWAFDPRRFGNHATKEYTRARAVELYQNEYAIGYPCEERPAGRPAKTTALYGTLQSRGARFGARGGWERATWFAHRGVEENPRPSFGRGGWFDAVAAECHAVRERVAVMDMGGFSKFRVRGAKATQFLDRLICGALPRVGRVNLAYMCTPAGGVHGEFTVTRLAENDFYLCSAAVAETRDHQWMLEHRPARGGVDIDLKTSRYSTLLLAGPRSREVLAKITDADVSNEGFPWLGAREIVIGFARVLAIRISYTGELGWELHVPMDYLAGVYEQLMEAGRAHDICDFGLYALESLRLEKCYRAWQSDLVSEYTLFDAGLERFVKLEKGRFIGNGGLRKRRRTRERMVPLFVDAQDKDAPPCSIVFKGNKRVGLVTSGGFGHVVGRSIALAYVERAHTASGTRLEIEIFGERRAAEVAPDPIYDPENRRPRG